LRLITGDGGRSGQARGQHPARLFLSNISTVRHWNLPPGAAAIRAVGAVALATIPPPYDSILLKTVYHNADTGLIDFFPCKLVPDGARMPRYADDQQHDSPLRECRGTPTTSRTILLRSYAYGFEDSASILCIRFDRHHDHNAISRDAVVAKGEGLSNGLSIASGTLKPNLEFSKL
jgi:hypothetical protein